MPELLDDLETGIRDAFTNGSLKRWRAQKLLVQVGIAQRKFERNKLEQAAKALSILIHHLELYELRGWLSPDEAQALIGMAQDAIDLMLE